MNISSEDYDKLAEDLKKELVEYETFNQLTHVYGRKNISKFI